MWETNYVLISKFHQVIFHQYCGFSAACIPNKKYLLFIQQKSDSRSLQQHAFQYCQIYFPVHSLESSVWEEMAQRVAVTVKWKDNRPLNLEQLMSLNGKWTI